MSQLLLVVSLYEVWVVAAGKEAIIWNIGLSEVKKTERRQKLLEVENM